MTEYKKFLIQQQTFDGSTYTNVGDVVDTQAIYNVVCQDCPFKHLPEIKELAKRDWNDEDGEDVYIPSDGLKFKAYDMEVKFLYVGTKGDMSQDIKGFIDFLYGKNTNGSPLMAIYDDYTQIGRRGVYVKSVSNDLLSYSDISSDVIAQFKVSFRVTDPVTPITLRTSSSSS
jgi:hypothetical protein